MLVAGDLPEPRPRRPHAWLEGPSGRVAASASRIALNEGEVDRDDNAVLILHARALERVRSRGGSVALETRNGAVTLEPTKNGKGALSVENFTTRHLIWFRTRHTTERLRSPAPSPRRTRIPTGRPSPRASMSFETRYAPSSTRQGSSLPLCSSWPSTGSGESTTRRTTSKDGCEVGGPTSRDSWRGPRRAAHWTSSTPPFVTPGASCPVLRGSGDGAARIHHLRRDAGAEYPVLWLASRSTARRRGVGLRSRCRLSSEDDAAVRATILNDLPLEAAAGGHLRPSHIKPALARLQAKHVKSVEIDTIDQHGTPPPLPT